MLSRPPPFDKIVMRGTMYLEVDGDIGDGHSGVVSDGVKLYPVATLGAPAFQTSLTFVPILRAHLGAPLHLGRTLLGTQVFPVASSAVRGCLSLPHGLVRRYAVSCFP
jgi:hypothetical protein